MPRPSQLEGRVLTCLKPSPNLVAGRSAAAGATMHPLGLSGPAAVQLAGAKFTLDYSELAEEL
jgi:hypothetical protein